MFRASSSRRPSSPTCMTLSLGGSKRHGVLYVCGFYNAEDASYMSHRRVVLERREAIYTDASLAARGRWLAIVNYLSRHLPRSLVPRACVMLWCVEAKQITRRRE